MRSSCPLRMGLDCRHGRAQGRVMHWNLSWRADPVAARIADRHYNRQRVGSPQFVPPGRCLVLVREDALWVTSWPFAQYTKHEWAGALVCTTFRNEGKVLSSVLIEDALAATSWWLASRGWEAPALGMVTFVDRDKTRPKGHPGMCYRHAGFVPVGETKGGLVALQRRALPPARAPLPNPSHPGYLEHGTIGVSVRCA